MKPGDEVPEPEGGEPPCYAHLLDEDAPCDGERSDDEDGGPAGPDEDEGASPSPAPSGRVGAAPGDDVDL